MEAAARRISPGGSQSVSEGRHPGGGGGSEGRHSGGNQSLRVSAAPGSSGAGYSAGQQGASISGGQQRREH